jgi:hypothetical protein
MKLNRILLIAAFVLSRGVDCFSQSVSWSGNGDGMSWTNAQNWVGQQVPGPSANVFITNSAGRTVVISSTVSVESILCSNALTISNGSLTVTAGSSSLQGTLTVANGASVSASGEGTTLASGGPVDIGNASLYVSGGAVLSLPGAVSFQTGCGTVYWEASGTGSILQLPGLITVQQPTCYDTLTIQASSGGRVLFGKLATIQADNGYVTVEADGNDSLVNLSALSTNLGALSLEASGGGSVLLSNLATSGTMTFTLNTGGFISTAQFTNVDEASFYVNGGAVMSLPGVENFQSGCGTIHWQADGTGSVLELPALISLQEPTCYDTLTLQGSGGGQVILSNAVTIRATNGAISVLADGSNSLVNLSALSTNLGALSLEASGGGSVLLSSLATGGNMSLTLNSGGFISTAQFTNIDGGSLYANGGMVLSLPGVASYQAGCDNTYWQASGTGSVLELPELIRLQEPACSDTLNILGVGGGRVILSSAVMIEANDGYVTVEADGSNSLVNVSALASNAGALTLEASVGGSVLLSSLATSGNLNLTLNPGGAISTGQFTNIDGTSLYAGAGVVLSLPGVASYRAGCANIQWEAAGRGSVLELPGLITLQEAMCSDTLTLQAASGGLVNLSNVVTIEAADGYVTAEADGTNSVVNLSALSSNSGALSLEASGGGNVQVSRLADGGNMNLTLNSGGLISTAQFTNIDGASLSANGGAVLSLPGVASYVAGCFTTEWEASGTGSILELPELTTLQGAGCAYAFNIQALSGGQVLLGNLESIANGDAAFLANDTGSIINLTNLTYFVSASSSQGSLTEQNGGLILFTSQALLLGNLAINIPAGNPILPPTVTPSQPLTLYGTPYHSYRLEEQNTLQPGSPPVTILIPLTNSFQVIAAVPPPNTVITVTDFVANPPILQIGLTPDNEAQLVLFGLTNGTYQIQSAASLRAPITWAPFGVAVMTNAFRIFPEIPPAEALQFYRAEEQ